MRKFSEFIQSELSGFRVMMVRYMERDHTLMGFFPAIRTTGEEGEFIVTIDAKTLTEVEKHLPDKERIVTRKYALVNTEKDVCYFLSRLGDPHQKIEDAESLPILTWSKCQKLIKEEVTPFQWAPGLFGP